MIMTLFDSESSLMDRENLLTVHLTLSRQGRGNAIHPPSKLGGILAHFYKKKLPTLNFRLSKSIALVNREVVL